MCIHSFNNNDFDLNFGKEGDQFINLSFGEEGDLFININFGEEGDNS